MPHPSKQDLSAVCKHQHLVTLKRRGRMSDVEGYVVGIGKQWIAVLAVHDSLYDGHVLLRRDDLRSLGKPVSEPSLTQRFLELDDRWPPRAPETLDLHDARSVAFTAGGLTTLLAMYRERRRPRKFVVGRVERITTRRIEFLDVTPKGRWGKPSELRLEQLTKLVLWDPYVEKLAALLR